VCTYPGRSISVQDESGTEIEMKRCSNMCSSCVWINYCRLRSKIWWFTNCRSHYVSHFAAFFIVARTKISVVKSRIYRFCLLLRGRGGWAAMAVKRVRLYPVDCWLCWGCVVINGMFFVLKGGTATSVCMYVCMYVCMRMRGVSLPHTQTQPTQQRTVSVVSNRQDVIVANRHA